MNVISVASGLSSSYPLTERRYGVCTGTLTCSMKSVSGNYCQWAGCTLTVYESYACFQRGDAALFIFYIVGASSDHSSSSEVSIRMVTSNGTNVIGHALSPACKDIWLSAIRSGLEGSLLSSSETSTIDFNLKPPQPQAKPPRSYTTKYCVSCGVWDGTKSVNFSIPIPQYGKEERQNVCKSCYTTQGLINHCLFEKFCREGAKREREALAEARELCYSVLVSEGPSTPANIQPTIESTERLVKLVKETSSYASYRQRSPTLDRLSGELLDGRIGVAEFMEHIDEDLGVSVESDMAAMKKEAFKLAGDMGTAIKLLFEYCLSETNRPLANEMVKCILDFLVELCTKEGVGSVAFFWPQICHIHLCMLPARDDADNQRIDLMEEFIWTLCSRFSVHLALELVWSHTADLEESLSTAPCSDACRARSFAILKFLCVLESRMLSTNDAWCGKSNVLGKMLLPTKDQARVLLAIDKGGDVILKDADPSDGVYENETGNTVEGVTAEEKLRLTLNAEYFSSHLSFTSRVCDIAEKLRFLDIKERPGALEEELNLLNSSGVLGGDPLNLPRNELVRVARVPSTEGHVFRSKERTPVLLLMETVSEAKIEAEVKSAVAEEAPKDTASGVEPQLAAVINSATDENDEHDPARRSPKVTALKSFSPEQPTAGNVTPKKNVESMVSSAIPSTFADMKVPDLDYQGDSNEDVNQENDEELMDSEGQNGHSKNFSSEESGVPPSERQEIDRQESNLSNGESIPSKYSNGKRISSLGSPSQIDSRSLSPTSDIRRNVLNTIMLASMEGHSIAASSTESFKRSLKDLECQRATELLERSEDNPPGNSSQSPPSPGLGSANRSSESIPPLTEENETMESIRLLLIQQRVSQGLLSPTDAAKVLLHSSLDRTSTSAKSAELQEKPLQNDEIPTIDAGDVDPRLAGCGALPPSVLQALTLWKGGIIDNGELLELVKKDVEFVRHSVLFDSKNVDKLNENSAFWGRFAFGERWNEKKSRISSSSPEYKPGHWDLVGVIVKSNDDLRQEAFIMQLIELANEVFHSSGLEELWLSPYRILATGRRTGIIEMVKNAMSIDALKKRPGYSSGGGLRGHLQRMSEFTADPGESFKQAQLNFARSLASYSLLSYFFMFKDRHNGNILLDTTGHLIHIDFGFVFGIAPGGSFSLEMSTPFKLTDEMLEVLGGLRSPLFSEFVTLFCCGFLALQSYCETFHTLVEISCRSSTFKCFEQRDPAEVLSKLRERFRQDLDKEESVAFALDLIRQSVSSYGTKQYDMFQYLSQGIAA